MFGLSTIPVLVDKENKWINIEDFCKFLRTEHHEEDRIKIKKENIRREVASYRNNYIKTDGNAIFLNTVAVVKYICHHSDDFRICSKITRSIHSRIFGGQQKTNSRTLFDLYKQIATSQFTHDINDLIDYAAIESDVPNLELLYKKHFTEKEWSNICLFELHFANDIVATERDNTTDKKWEYFGTVASAKHLSSAILKTAKSTITRRLDRYSSHIEAEGIEIYATFRHRPHIVENQILNDLTNIFPGEILSVTCVSCHCVSTKNHQDLVELFVECNPAIEERNAELLQRMITSRLNQEHCLQCHLIVLFPLGSLEPYYQKNGQIARLSLHDDFRMKKLQSESFLQLNALSQNEVTEISLDSREKCRSCFTANLPKPLSVSNFEILKEWTLDVPLVVQIVLDTFINKDTILQSNNTQKTLKKKLERLYTAYDLLLNTYNKNFIGVLQQATTDELLMNYHSISNVFSITSASGITTSLSLAERNLTSKSIDDTLYFATYIKEHPLTYNTLAGEVKGMVSMRGCHIVLMLDNLVRLKYHSDPSPGEHRSKQLCMLPITLQGMPKDSVETESWHDANICDGTLACQCKRQISLSKPEAFDVILNPSTQETTSIGIFHKICRWGSTRLWRLLDDGLCMKTAWLQTYFKDMAPEKNEDLQEGCDVQTQDQIDVGDSVAADVTMYDVESPLEIGQCDLPDCIEVQSDSEEEDNLIDIMTAVDVLEKEVSGDANSADTTMDGIATGLDDSLLETSIDQLTLDDDTPRDENIMTAFGFQKYSPPPLLTRHPPPASGRDDDINKLREILDDILIKTELDDNLGYDVCLDRILLGPDNKIGMNLLSLIKENKKYAKFLPEFPLLHLRKSKVNTLFSAYKHAGLVELLMVMRDQDVTEWSKLLTTDHIDTATRHVRRIAQALQMAFLLKFIQSLGDDDAKIITWHLITGKSTTASETWDERMTQFMDKGRQMNATFALHYDMMTHCNEVVAISVSERLGGSKGYSLLLGTVKSSLKFSFLNGATSYAPYCARLLAHHYTAGIFHQKLKETLYSTPIGNSTVNFACDTKREMDHKDALKGFRSGSSLESASRRMSLIDAFNDIHSTKEKTKENDGVQWLFSNIDAEHIFRVVEVILRQNSLSLEACTTPFNMYSEKRSLLSREILDDDTRAIGEYLIQKFICHDQLFGLSSADAPSLMTVEGPKPLLSRVKRSKGVTIKRTIKATRHVQQSERDEKEAKRSKAIRREVKQTDCLSSEMNMCQALVKPDCSKPKVQKSTSMKNALLKCIEDCQAGNRHGVIESVKGPLPIWLTSNVKLVTLEFAGVKFKSKVITGKQYLHYVQNAILRPLPSKMPNLERIVLCEEKYSFTPDQFKAGTRQQRKKACSVSSITHLKPADDAITQQRFQRDVITGTTFGKSLISKYVAANAKDLLLPPGITLDIDSELEMHTCTCDGACTCKHYATPIRCTFDKESQKPTITALVDVQQRKGEAEMSQVDWLIASRSDLKAGERVVSLITSGDIDAVCIHLYAIHKHWPRDDNGSFINEVFVVLQKPHMLHDIYNITAIIQLFEDKYQDPDIGVKLALGLCIGGNDFIPKFKGISHTQILKTYLSSSHFRQNLFQISKGTQPSIDKDIYEDFVKHLYCPKNVSPNSVTVEEVRTVSMKLKKKSDDSFISQLELRNAETWMPPTSALHRLADLIQLQVEYLETAGYHDADLPDFMASSCLKITKTGEVEYDFGPEVHMNVQDIQTKIKDGKRKQEDTPQKGQRRKRQLTSTPRKKP